MVILWIKSKEFRGFVEVGPATCQPHVLRLDLVKHLSTRGAIVFHDTTQRPELLTLRVRSKGQAMPRHIHTERTSAHHTGTEQRTTPIVTTDTLPHRKLDHHNINLSLWINFVKGNTHINYTTTHVNHHTYRNRRTSRPICQH